MLPVPTYLKTANIQDDVLRYEWDDWRTLPAAETPNEELVVRLAGLSQRAALAFAGGSAEWIVYRLSRFCADPAPWDCLTAAWAMIVNVRYCGYGTATTWQVYADQGWDGPVRGPIRNALLFLEIALQELAWNNTDPLRRVGKITALATYVMSDPAPYLRWCEQVTAQLHSLYPLSAEDPHGDVVPREAINPDTAFEIEHTEELVNRFLSGLDYRSNVFLSPPEGMLQHFQDGEDFVGIPYRFDMNQDRQARRNKTTSRHDHD